MTHTPPASREPRDNRLLSYVLFKTVLVVALLVLMSAFGAEGAEVVYRGF
jgi:hypothetical protein